MDKEITLIVAKDKSGKTWHCEYFASEKMLERIKNEGYEIVEVKYK